MSDDPNLNAPAVETPAEPVPAAEIAAVETGETEAAAAETPQAPASAHDEPSFLEQATPEAKAGETAAEGEKPAEAKPDETKPAETAEAKPDEAKAEAAEPAAEPAKPEPLVYEPLVLPEGVSGDAQRLAEFDAIISPHRVPPEARDQLRDLHIGEMQRYADHLVSEQHRVWGETRKGWRDQIASDEEMGGNAIRTTEGRVARMRDLFVPEAHRAAFDDFLRITGAGDHPEFIRLLNNLGRFHDEAGSSPTPANPPPDRGGGAGRGRRLRDLYDHPRSQN